MDEPTPVTDRFRALHRPGDPLLLPNPWDAGSARILASMGFRALATTSSGHAASLGRLDGSVDRDEVSASVAQPITPRPDSHLGHRRSGAGNVHAEALAMP